jgi:1,4-dihydroxy-2-naphthoate octaprenyltransferase
VAAAAFMLFFYTAPPISLKYHALGDLFIILISGLGGTFGAFYVQAAGTPYTVRQAMTVLLFSLPVAFMGDVILNANNTPTCPRVHIKAVSFMAWWESGRGGPGTSGVRPLLVALVLAPIF